MRGYAKLPNQILLCGMNASDKKDILSYKKEVSKKQKTNLASLRNWLRIRVKYC